VLDCGSLDINGNNQYLFDSCYYEGVDVGPGENVSDVKPVHEVDYPDGFFDTIICTEMLEHDRYMNRSLDNMVRMLKPAGLLLITCATIGRAEHGTKRSLPDDSPFTNDYYKNVSMRNLATALLGDGSIFWQAYFEVNSKARDLYFWGIK
jgi:SAM-dependent methyltransferase